MVKRATSAGLGIVLLAGLPMGCAAELPAHEPVATPPSTAPASVANEVRLPREHQAPRRRLDRVVTLGQDAHLPGRAPAPTAAAPSTVLVQPVVVPQPAFPPGWSGSGWYGPVYTTPPSRPSSPVNPVTGTPPVGGDWPAPPDHGPPAMR